LTVDHLVVDLLIAAVVFLVAHWVIAGAVRRGVGQALNDNHALIESAVRRAVDRALGDNRDWLSGPRG
jgi:hypothetical protein